jgi:hypothetical protein
MKYVVLFYIYLHIFVFMNSTTDIHKMFTQGIAPFAHPKYQTLLKPVLAAAYCRGSPVYAAPPFLLFTDAYEEYIAQWFNQTYFFVLCSIFKANTPPTMGRIRCTRRRNV